MLVKTLDLEVKIHLIEIQTGPWKVALSGGGERVIDSYTEKGEHGDTLSEDTDEACTSFSCYRATNSSLRGCIIEFCDRARTKNEDVILD